MRWILWNTSFTSSVESAELNWLLLRGKGSSRGSKGSTRTHKATEDECPKLDARKEFGSNVPQRVLFLTQNKACLERDIRLIEIWFMFILFSNEFLHILGKANFERQ